MEFSPYASIWDIPNYNYQGYPPHSGIATLGGYNPLFIPQGQTDMLRVDFQYTTNHIEFWYNARFVGLRVDAYDSSDNLLTSSIAGSSIEGYTNFFETNRSTSDIAYVEIFGTANFWNIDDFGYTETGGYLNNGYGTHFTAPFTLPNPNVPEPSTMLLLGSGLLGLWGLRKKIRK